jgi:predicted ATP-dependent endonuclease of OLD family
MKISSFQIKNYRSIVDSKKCYLSPDSITALIGQNESGKTSVLEALRSFYEGHITDDILRSDLTFPEINCTFLLDDQKSLADYIDLKRLPPELHELVKEMKEVNLVRRWQNAQKSTVSIDEEKIVEFFKKQILNKLAISEKIKTSITELETEIRPFESGSPVKRNESEMNSERNEKLRICRKYLDMVSSVQSLNDEIKVNTTRLQEAEYQYKLARNDREARNAGKKLEQIREKQDILKNQLSLAVRNENINLKIADKVLSGIQSQIAEKEAIEEYEIEKSYNTPEEIGLSILKRLPVFEFFEDFSSLLPNKIDLDDLLNENTHAEGYKAARNFLCVAGLNADFFREENHRILKQKIENLNTEITVDFQDYWRQSVGKSDKIRINFELEHYDSSMAEKSGKPYLEFWVKDKQERLYPKQRSRGVRWFLSFYLELKAMAKENAIDRIMLIDEPGLSLHARAQEDVLKVFEDLRENLQIIYCTHSPNLIDLKKLYRIIAVQRAKESDEKSETIILDSRSLNEASSDTLSPIYALMGTRLNDRQFIFPENNFVVEDSVTFHYLEAMTRLYSESEPVHYIPASAHDQILVLTNLLFGWKVNFGMILSDNPSNKKLLQFMKETTFCNHEEDIDRRLIIMTGVSAVEDLFSTIDFKRFILKQRVGITVKNSEFIEVNKLSRLILVSDFLTKLKEEKVSFQDFDEETKANFERLFLLLPVKMKSI